MDADDLKKILAGFCIAGLIAGSTFTLGLAVFKDKEPFCFDPRAPLAE